MLIDFMGEQKLPCNSFVKLMLTPVKGLWLSGRASALHAEGPGFDHPHVSNIVGIPVKYPYELLAPPIAHTQRCWFLVTNRSLH